MIRVSEMIIPTKSEYHVKPPIHQIGSTWMRRDSGIIFRHNYTENHLRSREYSSYFEILIVLLIHPWCEEAENIGEEEEDRESDEDIHSPFLQR